MSLAKARDGAPSIPNPVYRISVMARFRASLTDLGVHSGPPCIYRRLVFGIAMALASRFSSATSARGWPSPSTCSPAAAARGRPRRRRGSCSSRWRPRWWTGSLGPQFSC